MHKRTLQIIQPAETSAHEAWIDAVITAGLQCDMISVDCDLSQKKRALQP
jgi:hypothetical protein